jgi:hypothetical protein
MEFGATGLGVADDTAAFELAISASSIVNTTVTLYVPWGKYRLTRSLKLPATCTKLVVVGDYTGGMKPDYLDVPFIGSVLYCKEVVGPVFEIWDASENGQTTDVLGSVCFDSITVDGANGANRLQSTTTCTGLISMRPGDPAPLDVTPTMDVRISCVCVANIATVGAKALDLSRAFWVLVENSACLYVVNGWGVYISSTYYSTTTVTIRKTYLHGCLECTHFGSNVFSCECDNVVFEASLIAISEFLCNITVKHCWFEAMGTNFGSQAGALTLVNGVSGAPISTVIYLRGGTSEFEHSVFWSAAGQIQAWVEGNGETLFGYGSGGTASFRSCGGGSNGLQFLLNYSSVSGFVTTVEDARQYYYDGSSSGVASRYADARKVTRGIVNVTFGTDDARQVTVVNGRFSYTGAAALTTAPTLGANLKGDRVRIDQPDQGAYSEYVCVVDGSAGDSYVGTWKGVGLVQA